MRNVFFVCALTAAVSLPLRSAIAGANVAPWLTKWSHVFDTVTVHAVPISRPDFLPGKTRESMHCGEYANAVGAGTWAVQKYDRVHHIGLAVSGTDACNLALFSAPPPGVSLPNADLSGYSTGRGGIHIGSSYAAVAAAYGKAPSAGKPHFVAAYSATIPGTTVANKPVALPETLQFTIDGNRVSAISIFIDLSGEV